MVGFHDQANIQGEAKPVEAAGVDFAGQPKAVGVLGVKGKEGDLEMDTGKASGQPAGKPSPVSDEADSGEATGAAPAADPPKLATVKQGKSKEPDNHESGSEGDEDGKEDEEKGKGGPSKPTVYWEASYKGERLMVCDRQDRTPLISIKLGKRQLAQATLEWFAPDGYDQGIQLMCSLARKVADDDLPLKEIGRERDAMLLAAGFRKTVRKRPSAASTVEHGSAAASAEPEGPKPKLHRAKSSPKKPGVFKLPTSWDDEVASLFG